MVRFGKAGAVVNGFLFAIALLSCSLLPHTSVAQGDTDQALLDQYLLEIERLISANDLEGARNKLTEAMTANLRDESLELVQSQLRLLESLNSSPAANSDSVGADSGEPGIAAATAGGLTAADRTAATDLLDSLRVAMENGELEKVRLFTDPTPQTDSLLDAVFNNYAAMRIEVSQPEADEETQSFLATLEFTELTTKDGDTAFPAQAWKTHRLRIVKSEGSWQKVLW